MKKFWNFIKLFLKSNWYIFLGLFIGTIVTLIWDIANGFFSFIVVMIIVVLYVLFRQIWWWVTKTGDYENKNKEK